MKPTQTQRNKKGRNKLSWLLSQSRDIKLDLVQNHLSICQIMLNELFDEEVCEKAGERYSHNKPHDGKYSRWGYNPGSVHIGDKKLNMDVPRIRNNVEGKFERLKSYEQVKNIPNPTDQLLQGVLKGLSMRDYEGVIDHLGEAFGLSKSSVSRSFIEKTEERLKEFESRDLSNYDITAVFIDGKYLAKEQIMIVLGITMQGDKIPLGFLQTHTENSGPIKDLFKSLIERGLNYDHGILFIIDGAKGIKKAIEDIFTTKQIIQRCVWHKRENVEGYLKEEDSNWFRSEYNAALAQPNYKNAKIAIKQLIKELKIKNISAARSLEEGLSGGILTLHKLEVNTFLERSFKTTNPIENVNSQLGKYLRKVKLWKNSNMRYRWIAAALLEIEEKMNKINNYKKLPLLRKAIQKHLSESSTSAQEVSTNYGT